MFIRLCMFDGCIFRGNSVPGGKGGAVLVRDDKTTIIQSSEFYDNFANEGGAVGLQLKCNDYHN